MALPEDLDGGHRAIVIEDVPPGTGIADLVGAFSPFGTIQFASMGPPAVVGFESEEAAAHALLVASMKSVSLLGVYREKATSPIEAAAMPPSDVAAAPEGVTSTTAETKASQNKAASVHIDQEATSSLLDSLLALDESLDNLDSLLTQHISKVEEEEGESALYWPGDNYYDAWIPFENKLRRLAGRLEVWSSGFSTWLNLQKLKAVSRSS